MVLFTADILLLFHTGFVISYNLKKKLILSGPAVARYYICHGSFIFDAISTVPLWMEVCHKQSSAHEGAQHMYWSCSLQCFWLVLSCLVLPLHTVAAMPPDAQQRQLD